MEKELTNAEKILRFSSIGTLYAVLNHYYNKRTNISSERIKDLEDIFYDLELRTFVGTPDEWREYQKECAFPPELVADIIVGKDFVIKEVNK